MANTQYSDYQKAVFQFIQTGSGNAVINAVAGAGKTFTITGSSIDYKYRGLVPRFLIK